MPEVDSLIVQASWINDAEFIGYFVAMAQGLYAQAGIRVEHRPGYSGLIPEMALLDGTADIALSSPESVAATVERTGAKLAIIGAQFQQSPLALVSSASVPLANLADLAGKTIAVPPANRALLEWLLAQAGLDRAQTMLVDYDHDAARLMAGAIDGFIDFPIDCTFKYAQERYPAHVVLLHDMGAPLFNNVVVVTEAFLAAHGDLLRRWLAASQAGWRDNASDLTRFPAELRDSYLTSERSLAAEIHANREFVRLMGCPEDYFMMSEAAVKANYNVLGGLGHIGEGLSWTPL